jgi:hypothetical protein
MGKNQQRIFTEFVPITRAKRSLNNGAIVEFQLTFW